MWGKGNKRKSTSIDKHGENITLISKGTVLFGDIQFTGALQIEGRVKGNVTGQDGLVRLADQGIVEGDIKAPNVVINGTVTGDLYSSDHLELASKAIVAGNVYYNQIEMVKGSQVNGSLEYCPKADDKVKKKTVAALTVKAQAVAEGAS
ncbi:polymer-forming cytoskeletal protein [Zooshikella marina]|uniref:Polymer-forming cytoskeletal protein n=1 Tax=Zooshikella ganghwensis TaxID=202772 RepID=A0A4P9VUZ0_9GAMM|nr:polymer-forming cytoskeletal protein [Zooshikella ganghwensis]MBU2708055.1 polymer-forming cytoskeletal protein [Zooshikella ganghwensis]RDH45720.1 polymer-forming cytoskeletal protein [Zooshikella ganghwensis]